MKHDNDNGPRAYYNEFDPQAAAWLRELIRQGHIAPGDVDERSIVDVRPSELAGYTQCHFFAGIGVWSYALRQAGWPDDRPVWTGSCPCQPHSAAASDRKLGFADPRDLWPAWFTLIRSVRPDAVFGEQVDDSAAWIDRAASDLEGESFTFGAIDLPACAAGAPNERMRTFFVANSNGSGFIEQCRSISVGSELLGSERSSGRAFFGDHRTTGELGRVRRIKPGVRLLAHGAPTRVGRLRGYGNAINAQAAIAFIQAAANDNATKLAA